MYCKNCGTELNTEWKFCKACGAEMPVGIVESPQNAAATTQPNDGSIPSEGMAASYQETATPTQDTVFAANPKQRKVLLIAVVVAIAIALVAAVGFMLWSQEQDRLSAERLSKVENVYAGFLQQEKDILINTGEGADKAVLLQQYDELGNLLGSLEESAASGMFALHDGSTYDLSEIDASITSKMSSITDWLAGHYRSVLASNGFPEGEDANSLSLQECQTRLAALTALQAEMESDLDAMGGQTESLGAFRDIMDDVSTQCERGNALIPQIQEREQAEAARRELEAKANGFIGNWVFDMGGGMTSPSLGHVTFYSDGRFFDKNEMLSAGITDANEWRNPSATWKRGDISNDVVTITTSYGTTFYYNMSTNTVTSSDGATYVRG